MELGDIEFPPGVKDLSSDMNPGEMVKALKVCFVSVKRELKYKIIFSLKVLKKHKFKNGIKSF